MKKYSASYFRDGLPEWKRKKDPILSRLFYREVSFYLSAWFTNRGITANTISYCSAIVAIIGCALFVADLPILGAICINLWLLLDCADGNIARLVKAEKYGEFADSMSSYICVGLMFTCISFCIYREGGLITPPGQPYIMLIGALASSSDSLTRLIYQKYLNISYKMGLDETVNQDGSNASRLDYLRIKIDQYVSVGGMLPAILLASSIAHCLDIVIYLWFAYYALLFISTTLFLVRKTYIANGQSE